MKKKILNTIWVMGVFALVGFCLSACNHELDIQQAYPFTVETMPVQKHIVKGQTAEIRCTLKRQGRFEDARTGKLCLHARVGECGCEKGGSAHCSHQFR